MMTNETHAEELQETSTIADLLGNDGEEAQAETTEAEAPADDVAGEEQKANDEVKPEPVKADLDTRLKAERDKLSRVRNDQVQLYRLVKSMEDDGVYSREDMAEKAGLTLGEVNRLLDTKPTAQAGEPEYAQTLYNHFEQDVKNPVVFNALARAYGGKEALDELKMAYVWAHRVDPEVAAKLEDVSPEEMTVHVFDTGKEYLEEYREAQASGITSPLKMLRQAKALQGTKQEQKTAGADKPAERASKPAQETMPTLAARAKAAAPSVQDPWMAALLR
jgi:hypothetical protein